MKWIRFEEAGEISYGWLEGETVYRTDLTWAAILGGATAAPTAERPLNAVRLLNPAGRPGKIVAIGLNYKDHIAETGSTPPEKPLIFTKFSTSVQDPFGEISWPAALTDQVDYEAELAVIIGRTARHVSPDEALDYVFGYTAANDVSARDLQFGDGQWIRGKSLDTFCPLGPLVVTADEIPDPHLLQIRCLVNGEVLQDSSTAALLFKIPDLIAFASASFTLEPGDIILTGTPHGVGMGQNPPRFLQDGDTVVVDIEKIGWLANDCRIS